MKLAFSYTVVLHRVFDSAPPEKAAVFHARGRLLCPHKKAGGVYVFVDEPETVLEISCNGYQPERVEMSVGETRHICLYPDSFFLPPHGWEVAQQHAPPGRIIFIADERCTVRLLAWHGGRGVARLQAKPSFTGGCLRFTKEDYAWVGVVLGKEPPNLYYLNIFDAEVCGARVEKGYTARADALGNCAVVLPQGFCAAPNQRRGALSALE